MKSGEDSYWLAVVFRHSKFKHYVPWPYKERSPLYITLLTQKKTLLKQPCEKGSPKGEGCQRLQDPALKAGRSNATHSHFMSKVPNFKEKYFQSLQRRLNLQSNMHQVKKLRFLLCPGSHDETIWFAKKQPLHAGIANIPNIMKISHNRHHTKMEKIDINTNLWSKTTFMLRNY